MYSCFPELSSVYIEKLLNKRKNLSPSLFLHRIKDKTAAGCKKISFCIRLPFLNPIEIASGDTGKCFFHKNFNDRDSDIWLFHRQINDQ